MSSSKERTQTPNAGGGASPSAAVSFLVGPSQGVGAF